MCGCINTSVVPHCKFFIPTYCNFGPVWIELFNPTFVILTRKIGNSADVYITSRIGHGTCRDRYNTVVIPGGKCDIRIRIKISTVDIAWAGSATSALGSKSVLSILPGRDSGVADCSVSLFALSREPPNCGIIAKAPSVIELSSEDLEQKILPTNKIRISIGWKDFGFSNGILYLLKFEFISSNLRRSTFQNGLFIFTLQHEHNFSVYEGEFGLFFKFTTRHLYKTQSNDSSK
ncbi:hypothetical protein LEP1GSC165_2112 [Leptospira santarosai str. CBC523]|nr:hypothetical protein LEP1GSC165_2112 [Leptospira santarosai str. CBC523]